MTLTRNYLTTIRDISRKKLALLKYKYKSCYILDIRVANPPGLSGSLPDFRQNLNLPAGDRNLPDSSKSPGKIVNSNICLVNSGRKLLSKTEVR